MFSMVSMVSMFNMHVRACVRACVCMCVHVCVHGTPPHTPIPTPTPTHVWVCGVGEWMGGSMVGSGQMTKILMSFDLIEIIQSL